MPAVTRVGDPDVPHCSPMARAIGSGSVFVNGRALSFQGCVNTAHLIPDGRFCIVHVGPITLGSTTVRIHGLGVGRVGDAITTCTFVAVGSPNVFAGG